MAVRENGGLQGDSSDNPVLLRVDFQAGHGIGSTRDQYLQERADQFAFLFSQLGKN